jgi:hypothetical protein
VPSEAHTCVVSISAAETKKSLVAMRRSGALVKVRKLSAKNDAKIVKMIGIE